MVQLTIQQAFDLALRHHQAGRLPEAEQLYRQILAQVPQHFDALHLLGVIANQCGQNDTAVDLILQALAINPHWAEAHNNLGRALKGQGQFNAAIAAYRQAIALRPDYFEAHNNLGVALAADGQLEEAIAACRLATDLNPNAPEGYYNLGIALTGNRQLDDAIAAYRRAIELNPNFASAYTNLGIVLKSKGELDSAILAYRQSIAAKPNEPVAYFNLGNALDDKGQPDDAMAAYRQAISIKPNYPEALKNLGNCYRDTGLLDEALDFYRRACSLAPSAVVAHSNIAYAIHFHPQYNAKQILEENQQWARQHAEPLTPAHPDYPNDRDPDRPLRIGYVSPDFRYHAAACFLLPLLQNHEPGQVQVFCYSSVQKSDEITGLLRAVAHEWRDAGSLTDDALARQIRDDRIDVLIDCTLHMAGSRLLTFARRPAPVQVTWLGYPSTTGLSAIDYRLTDPYLDPPGMDESVYSERTVRLPETFWCYDPLDNRAVPVSPLPALQNGFVTFGCLNNFCKVNDELVGLWGSVLRQVKNSRLLLLAREGSHRQRTWDRLAGEGIDPQRVEFVPQQSSRSYMETYQRIDVGLDSYPYNGHTTSLDSWWMGVPVVTRVGSTAVSRGGWCQVSNLGLPELAGHSPEQFVQIAVDLAADLPRLKELRATLRQRMERSPLMDAPRFARNIEAAYRQLWRSWCRSA